MNHYITLQQATSMTTLYRNEKENLLQPEFRGKNILPLSESFARGAFDRLLSQTGCSGIRLYYGLDDAMRLHAVVVGYDENGADILPALSLSEASGEENFEGIVEEGSRCPDLCPPASPLNTDQP